MPNRREHVKSSMQSSYASPYGYGKKRWKSIVDRVHKHIDAPSQKHPGMAHRKYGHDYVEALAKAPSNMVKASITEQHIIDDSWQEFRKRQKKMGI